MVKAFQYFDNKTKYNSQNATDLSPIQIIYDILLSNIDCKSCQKNRMQEIKCNIDIKKEIKEKSFCHVKAEEFIFHNQLKNSFLEFSKSWDNLIDDQYLAENQKCKKRRFSRLGFTPSSNALKLLPTSAYYQPKYLIGYYKGLKREYEPIEKDFIYNQFLKSIIQFNFSQSNINKYLDQEWIVSVHQYRLVSYCGEKVEITPEKIHQDGVPYGAVTLIKRHNIQGAISKIYDLNKNRIAEFCLLNSMDSYYLRDFEVMHCVSEFTSMNQTLGYRDVLLTGFTLPGTEYARKT